MNKGYKKGIYTVFYLTNKKRVLQAKTDNFLKFFEVTSLGTIELVKLIEKRKIYTKTRENLPWAQEYLIERDG